jgi:hypothetical protein
MSLVYWGIVAGLLSMVVLLFFCIAVIPTAQRVQPEDRVMTGDGQTSGEVAVPGTRHAA